MKTLVLGLALLLAGCVGDEMGEFSDDPPCLYLYSLSKNEPQHPPSEKPGRLPDGGTPTGGGLIVMSEVHSIGDGRPSYFLEMSPRGWRFMKMGEAEEYHCVLAEGYQAVAFPGRIPNGGRACYHMPDGCYTP